ncbi:MAG: tRNA dimethylallyltransferase [bacterium P3]|nr:MAG: tRNA dimethylallyltransferase [bacterium P3]KWW40097.1 MAG: tRNA dimethylallyltransferase [bacterium F083]
MTDQLQRLLTVTGPTASGKTSLAVVLARALGGEIISADSRQVFRGMDLGTGKDLSEYTEGGPAVRHHLIDIHDPGYEYNLYQFQNDFLRAFRSVVSAGRLPILCGGSGLYVDAVVRSFPLSHAPVDAAFRASVAHLSDAELIRRLSSLVALHNHTDTDDRDRLVRALEIQEYALRHPGHHVVMPPMDHLVFAVTFPRDILVRRIEWRLLQRLQSGMVDEVRSLLAAGVPSDRLKRYGLEYRHLTAYLLGECTYGQMYDTLFRDIRRFAKRQMTYLRHMERHGVAIHWLDGRDGTENLASQILRNFF